MIDEKNIDLFLFFYHLANNGSIEKAIKELKVSRVTIYRKIKELEASLGGVSLFINNRKGGIALTPFGEVVFEEVSKLQNNIRKSREKILSLTHSVGIKKTIKIVTTTGFMSLLVVYSIEKYVQLHPDINFIVNSTNEEFNPNKFSYDMAFFPEMRLNEQKYVVKNTGFIKSNYLASQAYIKKYGIPKSVKDLEKHELLKFHLDEGAFRGPTDWIYRDSDIKRQPRLTMNSLFVRIFAVSRGLGIANLPTKVNDFFNLGLVVLDAIPSSSADSIGAVLRSKYNQEYIQDFFDFTINEMCKMLKN